MSQPLKPVPVAGVPLREVPDEPPPFLGTWPRVYVVILVYLVTLINLFAWFSRAFTPPL